MELKGVNIIEEAIRTVVRGDVLPHELGYVGPIYSQDEYNELRNANPAAEYALSDQVGKTGLEAALEDTLCGTKGVKQITVTNGEVSSVEVTKEPVGGKTVQLTVTRKCSIITAIISARRTENAAMRSAARSLCWMRTITACSAWQRCRPII